ncbi:MAG: hypothetical protein D6689_00195 [Deltaproteobacteria bacterium]|nr:MAG: hypothetical protein D6689_00195 [Deltaproteobacteria bacterium]
MPAAAGAAIVAVVVVAALSRVGCVNVYTPPGHEGYIKSNPIFGAAEFVGTQDGPTSTGWVWRQQVVNIDMRPRTYSEEMTIPTKDRLELKFRAHARIQLRRGSVKELVEQYGGENWYRANVQDQFRSAVRAEVQQLDAFEVKDRMADIGAAVLAAMKKRYGGTPIEFISVDIGNIDYPEQVVRAVVGKFVTNEDNERKDIELRIAQRQIDIGIAEAQGVADAQRIIRTTLDPMFLQYKALKAIEQMANSANTTFVVMPYNPRSNAPLIMQLGGGGQ